MLAPGTILQDRYKIVGQLGQGGMGAVYQATDLRFGSTVALKQTLVGGDELVKAFEREARLLNKLRHAALPVVIDYFVEGEGQFLVMQYIPGSDLGALLERNGGPFPPETVLRWAEQLLDALEYLHTQDPAVIHRDIKPQNLKLTPRGEVILLDFGLSKSASAGQTRAATSVSVVGYTPHYAPFEQINGVGTDPRSDLFSLAATVYHLMTGNVPPDAMSRAHSVMSNEPDPLRPASELNPAVPSAAAMALHSAMAMNRDERPSSAAELRAALRGERSNAFDSSAPTVVTSCPAAPGDASSGARTLTASVQTAAAQSAGTQSETVSHSLHAAALSPRRWIIAGSIVALLAVLSVPVWWTRREQKTPPAAENSVAKDSFTEKELAVTRAIAPPEASFKFETVTVSENGSVKGRRTELGRFYTEDLGGGVSIDLVSIPGGSYMMGTHDAEKTDYADEGPQHEVRLKPFYMGKFEVTQAQWRAVAALPKVSQDLNPDPSTFKGDDLPVENVSWEDATEFCARLSKKSGRNYRLPSESEWEYAARAGTTTMFAFGETITSEVVNFDGTAPYGSAPKGVSRNQTTPVGSLKVANAFGLYDVHGNVWEWSAGEYHDSYEGSPSDGSAWETNGDVKHRVMRGGSWNNFGIDCRSANRFSYAQDGKSHNIGFRLVMSLERKS